MGCHNIFGVMPICFKLSMTLRDAPTSGSLWASEPIENLTPQSLSFSRYVKYSLANDLGYFLLSKMATASSLKNAITAGTKGRYRHCGLV